MISASSIERLTYCPTSAALPPIYETTTAADQGTANHLSVASKLLAYRDAGILPEGVLGLIVEDTKVIAVEHSFVFDAATGDVRVLGEGVGRNYGALSATEIACTVDVVLRFQSGLVQVIDWKSSSYGDTTESSVNWQLKVQALCVAAWLSVDEIEVGLCYLDTWEQDTVRFDSFQLATIQSELFATVLRVEKAKPVDPVHLGAWCKYCPARHACTGRAAIVNAGIMAMLGGLETIDASKYGAAWEALGAAADAIEAAREVVKASARRAPIRLPSGKRLALVECKRKSVDGAKLDAMLLASGIEKPMKESRYTQLKVIK